jgi:hypothetical protein
MLNGPGAKTAFADGRQACSQISVYLNGARRRGRNRRAGVTMQPVAAHQVTPGFTLGPALRRRLA